MIILISPVGGLYITGSGGMSSQVDVIDVSSGETSRGPSILHPHRWLDISPTTGEMKMIVSCEILRYFKKSNK